jgi:hypothetical protein
MRMCYSTSKFYLNWRICCGCTFSRALCMRRADGCFLQHLEATDAAAAATLLPWNEAVKNSTLGADSSALLPHTTRPRHSCQRYLVTQNLPAILLRTQTCELHVLTMAADQRSANHEGTLRPHSRSRMSVHRCSPPTSVAPSLRRVPYL